MQFALYNQEEFEDKKIYCLPTEWVLAMMIGVDKLLPYVLTADTEMWYCVSGCKFVKFFWVLEQFWNRFS